MSEMTKYDYLKLAAIAVNAYERKFLDQDILVHEIFSVARRIEMAEKGSDAPNLIMKDSKY